MPRPGGEADKLGNYFESVWTVNVVLDVFDGISSAITVEPPGDLSLGVEFYVEGPGGSRQFHSVKRQKHGGDWSIADLCRAYTATGRSVLGDLFGKSTSDSSVNTCFVSSTGANEIRELSERASKADDVPEFRRALSAELQAKFDKDMAVLIPLFWMVSASLKTQNEVYDFAWLPRMPQWHNYVVGLTTFQFGRYFINTILVTGINVVAGGIVASWTAFAMARLEFPGRNLIFALVLGTMMLPFAAYMIPSFVLLRWLGWIDTYTVLTVPFFLAVPGFFVFLIRQYYMTIPREFDDSAKIDGCNFFKIYWYLLLPLSRRALTTVGIYIFLANWEDLIRPVLFINSKEMRTVSVGLALLSESTEQAPEHHLMMAVSTIFIIVPIVIFLMFQRYFRQMGEGGLDTVSIK